jgi:hypothetical protein
VSGKTAEPAIVQQALSFMTAAMEEMAGQAV